VLVHLFDTKAEPCVRMKPPATVEEAAKRAAERISWHAIDCVPAGDYHNDHVLNVDDATRVIAAEFARVPAPPAKDLIGELCAALEECDGAFLSALRGTSIRDADEMTRRHEILIARARKEGA
jgi:hypothetical protein